MGWACAGEGEAHRPTPPAWEGEVAGVGRERRRLLGLSAPGWRRGTGEGAKRVRALGFGQVLYEFIFSRPDLSHPYQINGSDHPQP